MNIIKLVYYGLCASLFQHVSAISIDTTIYQIVYKLKHVLTSSYFVDLASEICSQKNTKLMHFTYKCTKWSFHFLEDYAPGPTGYHDGLDITANKLLFVVKI